MRELMNGRASRTFRWVATVVALLSSLGPAGALARGPTDDDTARNPQQALLDAAYVAGGAPGSDLLLLLVESGRVSDPELRRQAVDAALLRASEAVSPYPATPIAGVDMSCLDAYRATGLLVFPVDGLRLRCRAIHVLCGYDRLRARAELERLPPDLGIAKGSCADGLVANPADFYGALLDVHDRCFSPRERKAGLHTELVRRYLKGIETFGQVGPAAAMISRIEAGADARAAMVGDLASAVGHLDASARDLFVWAGRPSLLAPIETLLADSRVPRETRRDLATAIRAFVAASLESPRCADLDGSRAPAVLGNAEEACFADRPVAVDELESPDRGDAPKLVWLHSSAQSRRMLLDFQNLNQAVRNPGADFDRQQWRIEFMAYLGRVRDWNASMERSDEEYLIDKCETLVAMFRIAPDPSARRELLAEFVAVARHAAAARIAPQVLLYVTAVMFADAEADARAEALAALETSGPPVLAAYAALEQEGVDALRIGATASR